MKENDLNILILSESELISQIRLINIFQNKINMTQFLLQSNDKKLSSYILRTYFDKIDETILKNTKWIEIYNKLKKDINGSKKLKMYNNWKQEYPEFDWYFHTYDFVKYNITHENSMEIMIFVLNIHKTLDDFLEQNDINKIKKYIINKQNKNEVKDEDNDDYDDEDDLESVLGEDAYGKLCDETFALLQLPSFICNTDCTHEKIVAQFKLEFESKYMERMICAYLKDKKIFN